MVVLAVGCGCVEREMCAGGQTMSHTLIVTAPRCTLCMLNPTVGINPSLKLPVLMT